MPHLLEAPGPFAAEPPSRSHPLLLAGSAVVLALVAGLIGFLVASPNNPAHMLHGNVFVGDGQASARVGTTFYEVPPSLPWRDAQGRWHENGLPPCLGALGSTTPITFAAVNFKRDGLRTSSVVWVDCSR